MIVPVMAISNLVLTQQIYSEETNGAHAHYREPVPLSKNRWQKVEMYGISPDLNTRRLGGCVVTAIVLTNLYFVAFSRV